MARKKKEQAPPPAPVRPIQCAFCQKELDPAKDQVTFIGVGKCGIRKLVVIQGLMPVVEQSLAMIKEISESPSLSLFMKDVRKIYDDNIKSICDELDFDPNDPAGDELAHERSAKDIRAVIDILRKYGLRP